MARSKKLHTEATEALKVKGRADASHAILSFSHVTSTTVLVHAPYEQLVRRGDFCFVKQVVAVSI
jgi:hypothetical protein